MFPGFFVGTIFLFWLVRTLMWGPRFRYRGYRHRSWGGSYGSNESLWGDFEPARRADDPPRATRAPEDRGGANVGRDDLNRAVGGFVRALRERLRTTPGQGRAFDAAVAKVRAAMDDAQTRLNEARDDIARAVRSESFDESAFDAAARRIGDAMEAVRGAARDALADVHDRLDERQREALADLIGGAGVDL
jgi:hypothetical protein